MAGAAPAVCTAVGTEDVLCPLHLCVELNRALPWLLGIGLLWLLEPWLMYFTWFWGQWDFSGGRVDFQTIAFQWIDSASLKVNSAGETISTLIPGRELMSGCWCHVSLWMNFSCAASSSTSASPCALAACCVCWHCPALCTPHFYPPSPALLQDMQLPQTLLCGLVAPHEQPCSLCTDPQPWGPLWHGCFVGVLLWEFPLCWSYSGSLWICTMWQTWPLLAQGLQYLIYYWTFKVRHAVAVNTLLYHTWSTSDLSSAGALWGRHHRGMEVQHLEEMMKAFYFWGLNFSSWLQKSES